MTCKDTKLCRDCIHYEPVVADVGWDPKCGRLQKRVCDKIYGTLYYPSNNLLNCESERQESKDFSEWIFGERKDKCGSEGKYWKPKPLNT
jgi:hypothetical protein